MFVYVVFEHTERDCGIPYEELHRIFSRRDTAMEYIKDKDKNDKVSYHIERWEMYV